ncbi:carbohydrate ABC transporter permease [Kitasatospora atroaurantiaca]|uniref:Carbohydrate ABC transporter membrane protein 2 (CUT1 family) n=1 Tax=Kitasatospora atroaurantiaca TaxID=285545 RepID=A0A561EIS4_9ACTN|nr:carbohydrate ABC transporter permease [Kitasatospora atroaurantiaca]TWE15514.1 carbohydrate ABC transporter membrane protein 2 (CUT1 family) [Kitasatospora atroaurantiaca]
MTARARRRRPAGSTALTGVMLLMLVYTLLPLLWLVMSSTKDSASLFDSFGLWFGHGFHLFQNVHDVVTYDGGIYLRWFGNTVLYSVLGAGGAAVISTAGGYALAKYEFRGRRLIFAVVLGAVTIPGTALAVPTYLLFSKVGLVDSPWAVLIPSLASPFGLYLMRVYALGAVPDSMLEAARIDGSGELRTFFTISLRLLAPGFVTVLLFSLVATWNNYFLPLIVLSDPQWFPLTVGLNQWNSLATGASSVGTTNFYPLVITGSLLAIVPLVLAFLFLQRFWQSGLAAGSVKE